eukprot:SAG25_NODE_139_length_14140_cov_7.185101_10_plen_76_part_00
MKLGGVCGRIDDFAGSPSSRICEYIGPDVEGTGGAQALGVGKAASKMGGEGGGAGGGGKPRSGTACPFAPRRLIG